MTTSAFKLTDTLATELCGMPHHSITYGILKASVSTEFRLINYSSDYTFLCAVSSCPCCCFCSSTFCYLFPSRIFSLCMTDMTLVSCSGVSLMSSSPSSSITYNQTHVHRHLQCQLMTGHGNVAKGTPLASNLFLQHEISPSVLWHCWFGNKNSIQPVKTGCWFVGGDNLTGALHVL